MMLRPLTSANKRKTFLMSASLKSKEIFWPVYFFSALAAAAAGLSGAAKPACAAALSARLPERTSTRSRTAVSFGSALPTTIFRPPASGAML